MNLHDCPQCGEGTLGMFCAECYGLLDGQVKARMRIRRKIGSPGFAIQFGLDALAKLAAAGVPVKTRKAVA